VPASPAPAPTNGGRASGTIESPAPAPATPAAPAAPAQPSGPLTLQAVRMKVEPQPGDKAKLSFFDNDPGHKYPEIVATRPVDKWVLFLSACGAWTADHFKTPGEYNLVPAYKLTYHLSEKTNTKGNPYRDLDRADPA